MRFGKRSRWLVAMLAFLVLAAPNAWSQGKAPAKAAQQPAKRLAVTSEAASSPSMAGRRDPFAPLVQVSQRGGQAEAPECKEAGVRGLVISTLRVDGVVKTQSGMIAVVSNPQQRVYFVRDGEQVCNGKVQRISFEGITFSETGRDAFGKPLERTVSKPLYPSAGVQR